jgi:hypothetical protein
MYLALIGSRPIPKFGFQLCFFFSRQFGQCISYAKFQLCMYGIDTMKEYVHIRGLLDISTARYFSKVFKTILHKPKSNSGINIFYNKCVYKYYLQLL